MLREGAEDHAQAWDHRHEDLNANNFFNNRQGIQRPLYRYMIAGYSLGGPVYIPKKWNTDKRRLFFFISQEFTQIAQPTSTITSNMPTAAERAGDFSNTRNAAGQIIPILNPATGTPFHLALWTIPNEPCPIGFSMEISR